MIIFIYSADLTYIQVHTAKVVLETNVCQKVLKIKVRCCKSGENEKSCLLIRCGLYGFGLILESFKKWK